MIELLRRDFARARVPVEFADRPFVRGVRSDEIVQMDVARTDVHGRVRERILIWPGKKTELRVLGADRELQQLVLRVREPQRAFTERVRDRETGRMRDVVRTTDPELRRFLVGMDESHLFVSQLTTPATTVADAHRGLRPKELEERPEAARQGEWFFVPATESERVVIQKAEKLLGRRHERIGTGSMRGRPHVADQLVRIRDDGRTVEFVRGRIRHPDHRTLVLEDWMRVFMNTENRAIGSTWVD